MHPLTPPSFFIFPDGFGTSRREGAVRWGAGLPLAGNRRGCLSLAPHPGVPCPAGCPVARAGDAAAAGASLAPADCGDGGRSLVQRRTESAVQWVAP
jgi:hypothetical protein